MNNEPPDSGCVDGERDGSMMNVSVPICVCMSMTYACIYICEYVIIHVHVILCVSVCVSVRVSVRARSVSVRARSVSVRARSVSVFVFVGSHPLPPIKDPHFEGRCTSFSTRESRVSGATKANSRHAMLPNRVSK